VEEFERIAIGASARIGNFVEQRICEIKMCLFDIP
jgi:hypothetical protein